MRKSDFTLPTLDDLFSTQAERDDAKLERVRNIPLAELHPFKGHPFKVQNNEEMQRMIESIRKVGAITPALARPLPDGGYELISGHRRLAACQVLGVETMPVIVRELSDDEEVLEPLGIEYRTKRTGKSRLIKFQRRDGDDANDAGIAI